MSLKPSRGVVLMAALLVGLAAAGGVAWEARRATRAERATAEAVLRDYAAFAAWEYARVSREQLLASLDRAIAGQPSSDPAGPNAPAPGCGGGGPREVRTRFIGRPGSADWKVIGRALPPAARALLEAAEMPSRTRRTHVALTMRMIEDEAGNASVLAWHLDRTNADSEWRIHGIVADAAILTPAFREAQHGTPLLPPALLARAGSRDVVALGVHSTTGRQLLAAATAGSSYRAEASMEAPFADLVVSAAIAPESAGALVIGGLPTSRLPIVYGLVALAVGLVAIALAQIRREIALARLRSEFVSGVSHELRTPLAQIRMFAETLSLGRVRSAQESQRSLEIILQESQRLSQLVDNVLCFSRAERDRVTLDRTQVAVAPFLRDFADTVQPLARSRRAALELAAAPDLVARVDLSALRQMLLNLVDNALKYGPAGQTIAIGADRAGGALRVWVDDEGPGVDPRDQRRIWQPFWRGAGSAQGGSGIGLAIVRDLAIRHGGAVRVERAPRGGARFVVELPDPVEAAAA